MIKFTPEFIEVELALAEKATPGPIVMEWNWQWGMKSIMAWVETPRCHGDKFMDVAEIADNDRLYSESAYNNYPTALKEIQRLRERLDAANARITELEQAQEWHAASEPPDDERWVLVEMKDGDEKFIMPCWYDGYPDKYWHVEHFRMGDVLRWRELPGVSKEKSK